MAETSNQLGFIKSVCSHLHPSHSSHLGVPLDETIFGDFHIQIGFITLEGVEGILVKCYFERLRMISGRFCEFRAVRGSLEATNKMLAIHQLCQERLIQFRKPYTYKPLQNSRMRDPGQGGHGGDDITKNAENPASMLDQPTIRRYTQRPDFSNCTGEGRT